MTFEEITRFISDYEKDSKENYKALMDLLHKILRENDIEPITHNDLNDLEMDINTSISNINANILYVFSCLLKNNYP